MRNYTNPAGESVIVYIIYSEDNRKVSHPPEVCFMGSGLEIVSKSVVDLPVSDTQTIKANKISTEIKNRKDLVLYWFKAGPVHTDSYLKQQLSVVLKRMIGKRTAGAMIRISTNVNENGEEVAFGRLQGFAKELFPLLDKYIP
jgi:EpsI family protein